MLQTLAGRRYVYQNPITQKYGLGTAILRLSRAVTYRSDFRKTVLPFVESLHNDLNELVHLNIREGHERVCIAAFTSPQEVNVASPVGQRSLLNGGCSAKVLFAFESDAFIDEYLSQYQLVEYTDITVTNPDRLREQLKQIRADGYCITRGERSSGVVSIGAPLFDLDGAVVASITCTVPQFRCSAVRLPDLVTAVRRKAVEISGHLGYEPLVQSPTQNRRGASK
jgi:DNA-binding IclR family transcriptional regulator